MSGANTPHGVFRLRIWFTLRFNRAEIFAQRSQTLPWIRTADWLFVLLLLSASEVIADDHAAMATLIVSVSTVSFLAFLIIEPATTRPAFQSIQARPPQDRRHQP